MDKSNTPPRPLDHPQISQSPYRFHAHVSQPKKKSYKMLFRRLMTFSTIGIGAFVLFGAFIVAPAKYNSYCQQNPGSQICQPLSMPSFASAKPTSSASVPPPHQPANDQIASLKINEQKIPALKETPVPTPAATSQPIHPAPTVMPTPLFAVSETGKFALQIGAYQEKAEAVVMAEKVKGLGFEGRVIEISIPNKGIWYRVQAGRFIDRNQAAQSGQQLRAKNIIIDFMITTFQASNV